MSKNKKVASRGEGSVRDTLRWTVDMDTLLLDALLEEVHKGNRPNGTFTTMAYVTVVKTMKQAIGPFFQKHHIKNRLKILKDHFNECYNLFHKWSGIGWNPMTNMFEAEQEVWTEICQDKSEAQKWRRTPIHNYDKLLEQFGRDRATSACAEISKDKAKRFQKEGIDLNDCIDVMSESDVNWGYEVPPFSGNMEAFTPEYPASNQSDDNVHFNQSRGTLSSRGSKRKAAMVDVIEIGYEKVTEGIGNLTNVMREVAERQIGIAEKGLTILQNSRHRHYTEEEVWNELETIGVMPEARLKCYKFLRENEKAKRQFFGVPRHVRMDMLSQLMTDAGLL